MTPVDPTGKLVTLTRDAPAVAAITGAVRGGEKAPADAPPYVVVVPLAAGPGPGRRAGVATWRHAFRCYGPKVQGGDRQAEALALAVWTSLDEQGPIAFPAPGGSGDRAAIYQLLVESMGGPLEDPDTGEPYVVLTTSMSAGLRSFV